MDQPQHADTPRVRFSLAIALGLASIAASILLITADGIGASVRWTHHAGAAAAPLLLVAGAIATVSIAHPPKGRHGFMRLVAVLAFTAWGIAPLVPDSAAGALNDLAILLFVLDAACVVVSDARTLRQADRPPPARATPGTPGLQDTSYAARPPGRQPATFALDAQPCCMRTGTPCACGATPPGT